MSKQKITSTYQPLFLLPNFSNHPCKIKIINVSSGKKSLGHHLLLNIDMRQKIAQIQKIIDK